MRRFITFEGGEGVGKTTLISSLKEQLEEQGHTVCVTREPGATPFGKEIRDLLLNRPDITLSPLTELLCFAADRAEHVDKVIKPALDRGDIVLCDRYVDSTRAYQGAARFLDTAQVEQLCMLATGGLMPELTLILDIDPELGLKRASGVGALDKIETETFEFHNRVRQAFLTIAEKEPDRCFLIDAAASKEEVLTAGLSLCLKS